MKKTTDQDLDNLFEQAKTAQNKLAETVELGVETRLASQLSHQENPEAVLFHALKRLCLFSGLAVVALTGWVFLSGSDGYELSSLVIEHWLLGI